MMNTEATPSDEENAPLETQERTRMNVNDPLIVEPNPDLPDALEAWSALGELFVDVGVFVIKSKVLVAKRDATTRRRKREEDGSQPEQADKRRRFSEDGRYVETRYPSTDTERTSSSIMPEDGILSYEIRKAKKMALLLGRMKKMHRIFQQELKNMVSDMNARAEVDEDIEETADLAEAE